MPSKDYRFISLKFLLYRLFSFLPSARFTSASLAFQQQQEERLLALHRALPGHQLSQLSQLSQQAQSHPPQLLQGPPPPSGGAPAGPSPLAPLPQPVTSPRPNSAPKNLDRAKIPHHDIEEDVDIEHCSDSEETSSAKREPKIEAKEDESSSAGTSPPKKKKKKDEKPRIMKPKCNCEELLSVDCYLETKELWDKFNELGTEMIITKTGR